ncbi:MAG: hypothetical protein NT121_17590 [Chloroflexi bacterium]|nr:hypothetical protein [Chloroflexota bacterium]
MKRLIEKIKSISKVQILAVILIVVGVAIMIPKAKGMFDFYKEVRYASENNFAAGNPSPDLLRPWMSIRYIAVAYGVPQEYLFTAAKIQPKKENSMIGINRLNKQMGLPQGEDKRPVLLSTLRDAILTYRANPVATGLIEQQVTDWMTIQYVSNCTGIPQETLFQEIGIPMDGNAFKPLGFLGNEVQYSGGPKALVEAVQKVVDSQGKKP